MSQSETLIDHFHRMGAQLVVEPLGPRTQVLGEAPPPRHRINVVQDIFRLALGPDVHAHTVDVQRERRHLVLAVREPGAPIAKYLCGHDERHWFSAGVTSSVRSVDDAMLALMPEPVRRAVGALPRPGKARFTRHNPAFHRQGEWFFVPDPTAVIDERLVLKDEPIRRGRSKPHYCAKLHRAGGVQVFVCPHYPNGLTTDEWAASFGPYEFFNGATSVSLAQYVQRPFPHNAHCGRAMVRDAIVHVTGTVKHPDHATLVLKGWHRVYASAEVLSEAQAFLD